MDRPIDVNPNHRVYCAICSDDWPLGEIQRAVIYRYLNEYSFGDGFGDFSRDDERWGPLRDVGMEKQWTWTRHLSG